MTSETKTQGYESIHEFMKDLKEELAAVDRFEEMLGRSTSHTKFHRKRIEQRLAQLKLLVN